jgi:hypothetical protein
MRVFAFLLFFIILTTQNSYSFSNDRLLTLSTKISASKQDIHFRTPAANSILDWSADTIDYGLDLGINLGGNFFTEIEYKYNEVKAGNSTDDDVENGLNRFSWHGVNGRGNDVKVAITYQNVINNKFSLSPTFGGFYKQFKISTQGGFGDYNGVIVDFSDQSPGNQTDSQYYGVLIGGKAGYKFSKHIAASLKIEYLLPISYKAENIWYGRDPVLSWSLKNSKDSGKGDHGIRAKFDIGFERAGFFQSVKLFGYYELIQIDGLVEIDESIEVINIATGETSSGKIDGRDCVNCLSIGKARHEAFGGGISLEF